MLYVTAAMSQNQIDSLAESVRRFCRSVELCDGYVRGYYGLKVVRRTFLNEISIWQLPDVPK